MKFIVLSSMLVAVLTMTGCTKEAPVEEKPVEAPVAAPVAAPTPEPVKEVVVVDEAIDLDSGGPSMAELQAQMRTINFDFDKYNIDFEMEPRVIANSALAKGDAANFTIRLEGNCDTWGSDEYNFALGLRRANAVKSAMVAEGVAAERISMTSYGESNPVCAEETKECWTQNRRVDIKLLP